MAAGRNPVRQARREAELSERLGCGNVLCILCGYTVPTGLLRFPRMLLEEHHVLGRCHDSDLTVIVCRNCHAELTEGQVDAGVDLRRQADPTKSVKARLLSLTVFVEELGPALRGMVAALEDEKP